VTRLAGIAASPGVAMGQAALLRQRPLVIRRAVPEAQVARELDRLDRALALTRRQLQAIGAHVSRKAGHELAGIFEAQLLMLEDRLIVPQARDLVAQEHVNAEWALQRALDEVTALFAGLEDDYLQERKGDVADVVGRLRRNLQTGGGSRRDLFGELPDGAILVADDLPPSVVGQIDARRVAALVVESGSRTHHAAILARSLGMPAVVGVAGAVDRIRPGDTVLVDGSAGAVLVNAGVEACRAAVERERVRPAPTRPAPGGAVTRDGVRIRIDANAERPADVPTALAAGADGIGLFRTEYLLGGGEPGSLDEETQYHLYRELLAAMTPMPVTIRTFDLDAGREARGGADDDEAGGRRASPLGLRGLRLSLAAQPLFVRQLRALARAARHGRLRVLFPFVTTVEEFRTARALLARVAAEVGAPAPGDPGLPVGAMIEVPSAALTADQLACAADFLSIGTNDLVQYCLAVDRGDARVAGTYDPLHPSVLRLIGFVAGAARSRHTPVSVCGEMAGDPAAAALLLGLGVTELSMAPDAMPSVRDLVTRADTRELRRVARRAERAGESGAVAALAAELVSRLTGRANGARQQGGAVRE